MNSDKTTNAKGRGMNGFNGKLGGLIALVSVIVGLAAVMQQQIESQNAIIAGMRLSMQADDMREMEDAKSVGAQGERFTEIETQFKNLDERTKRIEELQKRDIEHLDEKIQLHVRLGFAEIEGRIMVIEERVGPRRP